VWGGKAGSRVRVGDRERYGRKGEGRRRVWRKRIGGGLRQGKCGG